MNCLTLSVVFVLCITQTICYVIPDEMYAVIPGYPCPKEEVDTGCVDDKLCHYPNPKNPRSFIQCTAAGTAHVMPCANPLVWNDKIKRCDWAHNIASPPPPSETPRPLSTIPPATETPRPTPTETPRTPPTETPRPLPPSPLCPLEDIANTGCKGPKDCLYPHPTDCGKFIHCEVNADNRTGNPVVKDCAPGNLEWNDNKKECDYAPSPTCPRTTSTGETPRTDSTTTSTPSPTPSPTVEIITITTTTTTPSPRPDPCEQTTTTTTTPQPCETSPTTPRPCETERTTLSTSTSTTSKPPGFSCPEEDIIRTLCMGPKDCKYPNPDNCHTYIHCTVNPGNKTGTPVVKPCPEGLEWNNIDKICDWPANSTCPRRSVLFRSQRKF